jgi:hypothetical protein
MAMAIAANPNRVAGLLWEDARVLMSIDFMICSICFRGSKDGGQACPPDAREIRPRDFTINGTFPHFVSLEFPLGMKMYRGYSDAFSRRAKIRAVL